jgi:recombinational DNA repair ATPase RecF
MVAGSSTATVAIVEENKQLSEPGPSDRRRFILSEVQMCQPNPQHDNAEYINTELHFAVFS